MNRHAGFSPAARSLLAELGRGPVDSHHLGRIKKTRRLPIYEELNRQGAVVALRDGHVLSMSRFDKVSEEIRRFCNEREGGTMDSRAIASLLGSSHGYARSLLAELSRRGVICPQGGGAYVMVAQPCE